MSFFDLRQSDLVKGNGVGSIIDFPKDSLMLVGLDYWPYQSQPFNQKAGLINKYAIYDSRLLRHVSKKLNRTIDFLLKPSEAPPFGHTKNAQEASLFSALPFVRFPTWFRCPRCHLLHHLNPFIPRNDEKLYCTGEYGRKNLVACGKKTWGKSKKKWGPRLIPVRFLVACAGGHLTDFPFVEFLHLGKGATCPAGNGAIFLYATGGMGLAGIKLKCAKCDAWQPLIKAFSEDLLREALGGQCTGSKPWLLNSSPDQHCHHKPRLVERGSANIYFNRKESLIFIPDKQREMTEVLFSPDLEEDTKEVYDPETGTFDKSILRILARRANFSEEDIKKYMLTESRVKKGAVVDDVLLLKDEYDIFLNSTTTSDLPKKMGRQSVNHKDFLAYERNIEEYGEAFSQLFDRVVLLKKLKVTHVFMGFSRLDPNGESPPISEKNLNWLPGIEVRGEGIFLKLNDDRLKAWETKLNAKDLQRCKNMKLDHVQKPHRFVLIHTLAHLLIRQLSFDCGYGSTALTERLYVGCGENWQMNGLLIYTASGDSEGTMGGLVRQGLPGRMSRCLRTALKNAEFCSNDPLCMDSTGQGSGNSNLAACYACSLVPETACACKNQFLDRFVVNGSDGQRKMGYFNFVEN